MDPALIISNIALWIVVAALALVLLALANQIGTLHERIAPANALIKEPGPRVGEKAPILEVRQVAGTEFPIGTAKQESKSILLFFLSPMCAVCKTLLPTLQSIREAEREWLKVILATDEVSGDQRAIIERNQLEGFSFAFANNLSKTYQVSKLPYAVLISSNGVILAKQVINSNRHLIQLLDVEKRGDASVGPRQARQ